MPPALVTARRKGRTWYLGGLSAGRPRDIALSLELLGEGRFVAAIWKDSPRSDSVPDRLEKETIEVTSRDRLEIRMAIDGGFAARISPAEE